MLPHCSRWIVLAAMLLPPAAGASAPCIAASGERRVVLLELYTSEGCDSCCSTAGINRRGILRDDFAEKLAAISRDRPRAAITLRQTPIANGVLAVSTKIALDHDAGRSLAQAYIALYENDLATQVAAGENRGRKLQHDFVVRELAGPFAAGNGGSFDITHSFRLARDWKPGDLHIAAFVQNRQSGDVLQALAAPRCS